MASSLNPSMLAGMQELGKPGRVYSLHRSLIYRGHYMITRLWRSFPLLCQILSHHCIAHHLLWSHVRANDTVSTLPAAFSSSWRSEGLCSPSGATPLYPVVLPCSNYFLYYCYYYFPATSATTPPPSPHPVAVEAPSIWRAFGHSTVNPQNASESLQFLDKKAIQSANFRCNRV